MSRITHPQLKKSYQNVPVPVYIGTTYMVRNLAVAL